MAGRFGVVQDFLSAAGGAQDVPKSQQADCGILKFAGTGASASHLVCRRGAIASEDRSLLEEPAPSMGVLLDISGERTRKCQPGLFASVLLSLSVCEVPPNPETLHRIRFESDSNQIVYTKP